VVGIGQRPWLPAAAGEQELGAVQLLVALGQQDPVGQEGVVAGVGPPAWTARPTSSRQARWRAGSWSACWTSSQAAWGADLVDQAAARPAPGGNDGLHPGGVGRVHRSKVFGRGQLLLGHGAVTAWMAVQVRAGVLVGGGHAQQLLAQAWVHGAHAAASCAQTL
jgi:hypothetical protein